LNEPTITFCAAPSAENAEGLWLAPVLAAWPDADVPSAIKVGVERLGEISGDSIGEGALFVVLAGDEPAALVAQVFDVIHGAMIPAVVVSPRASDLRPLIHKHGVIVVEPGTSAPSLASMLFALSQRQTLVDRLRRDVRTGATADKGIRGEMDRLHEELHLAATVQRELLPHKLPDSDDLQFASMYKPATYVSGDLFDAREIDEHRVAFFVADAVGHGVPAALITMMLSRGLINQIALRAGRDAEIDPAACISGLNIELCQHACGNYRFATAVCGVLDKRDYSVKLAGAGHPASILIGLGSTRMLESQGPLLGVFAEAEYTSETFTLAPGETLMLYTDGFELAFPEPESEQPANATGRKRSVAPREYLKYMGVLDAIRHPDVRDSMDALATLVASQEGSLHQRDDVTALAIRRVDPAAGVLRRAA
jgi:serine phosphatase RsbU (regulator of sigma subunit)